MTNPAPEGDHIRLRDFDFEIHPDEDPVIIDRAFTDRLLVVTEVILPEFLTNPRLIEGSLSKAYVRLAEEGEGKTDSPQEWQFDARVQRVASADGVELEMIVSNCKEEELDELPHFADAVSRFMRKYKDKGFSVTLADLDVYTINLSKGRIVHSRVITISVRKDGEVLKQFSYDQTTDYSAMGEETQASSGVDLLDELDAELAGSGLNDEFGPIDMAEGARTAYLTDIAATLLELSVALPEQES